ncbi:dihydropteroate synthase : Dihydropteroate synthase OS=Planctomyces brasiliensis (strain ATCC 49424 / DSM 5305 / JCM 21570 / NBRC 103401 / IFAM 1448) GN=Plabr_0523 PE=3 SV=1: Pterin_bind [Gemmataceae bacterium]|nr:dihydropteroate synthase : Dihydropteroate synthase OS=Planctomyces brasiliensis (strain ATCC 49424 / DSM 5305 / JCM 21570 / NBRC 103401 / IFAM 1448) GN=Plabr_0523 PE=3 SV=1: Pterin_bind [Gemmataceae bacterium]VTT97132.1 dihydropteroate synthase : Dihydropteroate synthase OS=Planctomyces brasiliensis (strain ATCC 49424 / DSM 5305 / JCM 21570 / NBRC 103401 / IFAM 1448) GN=Plabr_0523 PE=3 SV=1: Pterin_bind [Gemmataceae bacterium]
MDPLRWHLRDRALDLGPRPLVMGIVNVTPDSFSDGGHFLDTAAAVEHGLKLVAEGADILDVGGESTRPGAEPVPVDEELRRVVPVVAELARRTQVPVSVDTMKPHVARRCLEAGAAVVNDVAGFRDPEMIRAAADHRAGVVVMHMRGTPQTMQVNPWYADVVREVRAFFEERLRVLAESGIPPGAVCLDPGIGFGKALDHNLDLLANLGEFAALGRPVCLGVSRKGFIGKLCGREKHERLAGSLAVACIAAARGAAHVLRVHDVAATRDAAVLLGAINRSRR